MGKLSAKYSDLIRRTIDGKSDIQKKDYDNAIAQMTVEWTESVIHQLQQQADEFAGHVTQLGQEITQQGKETKQGFQITVDAPFYWKFFNFGVTGSGNPPPSSHYGTQVFDSLLDYKFNAVNPHPDMVESIRNWIPTTGLFGGQKQEDYEGIAYGISVNILKRGLQPKPFVEVVFENDKIINEFTIELAEVTQVIFEELFKQD